MYFGDNFNIYNFIEVSLKLPTTPIHRHNGSLYLLSPSLFLFYLPPPLLSWPLAYVQKKKRERRKKGREGLRVWREGGKRRFKVVV